MKSLSVTIQMKATEQYLPTALFIMLKKTVTTWGSLEEIREHIISTHLKLDSFLLSRGSLFRLKKL